MVSGHNGPLTLFRFFDAQLTVKQSFEWEITAVETDLPDTAEQQHSLQCEGLAIDAAGR